MRIRSLCFVSLGLLASTAFGQGYSPEIAPSKMRVADGLEVKLVASEPLIRQPVAIEFDDRGRLWCIQYLQYPNPAGLKRVEVDRYSRTKYDKIPDPPPRGPEGSDRITILEDTDGDGRMDRAKDFVSGLSLASSLAFGNGGVYVLQAPYLLFYPDRNRDDVPDGDPEVLLKGFGMEDAHSVANSLTWGPDGWLYGLQGSTVTAKIDHTEFQQGVWRYHPALKRFELFAEGGGNMWGLDFNRDGELIASTNVGGNVMLHFVKDAYYWKQFGKHGALHNPHAFGWFEHVKHQGIKGGHVTVGGLFYEADTFPPVWRGRYIANDLLEHGMHWHELTPDGSTFKARQGGDVLAANDTWFAPSDLTLGPDGCLYVTDWHDKRTAHPDPDADWDRSNGRIYRIQPRGFSPRPRVELDTLSSAALFERLSDSNARVVRTAARILCERRDPAIVKLLEESVNQCGGKIPCWYALCLIERMSGLTKPQLLNALSHPDPLTRLWALRLIGNFPNRARNLDFDWVRFAKRESDVRVLSELANARWIGDQQVQTAVLWEVGNREICHTDTFIPMRLWWTFVELQRLDEKSTLPFAKLASASESKISREVIQPRLVRLYAAREDQDEVTEILLKSARDPALRRALLVEMDRGWGTRNLRYRPGLLDKVIELFRGAESDDLLVRIAARNHMPEAIARAEALVLDNSLPTPRRIAMLDFLADFRHQGIEQQLLDIGLKSRDESLAVASILILGKCAGEGPPRELAESYPGLSPGRKKAVKQILLTRPRWAEYLVNYVDSGKIPASDVSIEEARRIVAFPNSQLSQRVRKIWGNLSPATPEAKLAEVRRLNNDLRAAEGNAQSGRALFKQNCAACHRLFGEGNVVGPELTHANRKDRDFLLQSLVDPSGVVRKEYQSVTLAMKDGRILTGLIAARTGTHVTLIVGADERVTVPAAEIEEMKDSPTSLMPEDLYRKFDPDAIRDLFRYLQSDAPTSP